MAKINSNFRNLPGDYLFVEIQKRCSLFSNSHPKTKIYNLGIGDTTLPLVPQAVSSLLKKAKDLGNPKTYTGYGASAGDIKLRKAVANWYQKRGIKIEPSEVFISDGAKTDCANISSLFSQESKIAIIDPVYPVYRDANILSGKKIIYLPAREENSFLPEVPSEKVDLIFLNSPNNPTGAVMTKTHLKKFVHWAKKHKAVIIFDSAYSEYIQEKKLPKSIYEIEGAKKRAIEIQSFSKSAGFTGLRLGWLILPKELETEDIRENDKINGLWLKRQSIMFNGPSNIVQSAGLAVLSKRGERQIKKQIRYYLENAKILKRALLSLKLKVFGGENSPYLWVKCPGNLSSFEFFEKLLEKAQVVCIPGSGFGHYGKGYVRFSCFPKRIIIRKAVSSLKKNLKF